MKLRLIVLTLVSSFVQGALHGAVLPEDSELMSEAIDAQLRIVDERMAELSKLTQEKAIQLHRLNQSAGGAHFIWEDGVSLLNQKRSLAKMLKASMLEDLRDIRDLESQKKELINERVWITSTSRFPLQEKAKVLARNLKAQKNLHCQNFPLQSVGENKELKLTQDFGTRKDLETGLEWTSMGWWMSASEGRVHSCSDGKVVFSGEIPGRGQVLMVEHGINQLTVYANLDANGDIRLPSVGSKLKANQIIGSSHEKFYFEVRRDGLAVDPRQVLAQDKLPFRL